MKEKARMEKAQAKKKQQEKSKGAIAKKPIPRTKLN